MIVVLSALGILAVLAFPLVFDDPYLIQVAIMVMLFGYLSSAWNIIGGMGGQLALGHAAFVGLGAYTSTLLYLNFHVSPWIGMFAGGLVAAALSVIVGYPTFKLRGPYFVMATVAVGEAIRIIFQNTQKMFGMEIRGARGLLIPLAAARDRLWAFQFTEKSGYYYTILGFLVVILLVARWIERSKLGYQLAAVRDDEDGAEALGVDTTRAKLTAAALSGFFAALGGTFYAQFLSFIDPMGIMGAQLSNELALIAIIGGEGTVWGPVLGALILVPVSEITRTYLGSTFLGVHLVAYGAILMLVIMYMPQGMIRPLRTLLRKFTAPAASPARIGVGTEDGPARRSQA